jgi:uncharacterized protein (TIGR02996 family)
VTEEEALGAAIRTDLNDREAWTVYGDWLLAHGDPRGEAISLWARLGDGVPSAGERRALVRRYQELCAPERWLAGLPQEQLERMAAQPSDEPQDTEGLEEWEREGWEATESWARLEERTVGKLPVLSELEWRHGFALGAKLRPSAGERWPEVLATFRSLPASSLFCRATVSCLAAEDVKPLLDTGLLRQVRALRVERTPVAAFLALLSSPGLGELESLDFTVGDPVDRWGAQAEDEEWLTALVELPSVATLRSLRLCTNGLGVQGAQTLSASRLPLETLDLGSNELQDEGAVALAGSSAFRLRTLSLAECGLGDEGVAALADSVAMRGLQRLDLRNNHISAPGAEALATSLLAQLTHLDLGGNLIGNAGLRALLGSPILSGLRVLRVNNAGLSRRYDTGDYEPPTEAFRALPELVEFSTNERFGRMERLSLPLADRQADYYNSSEE